MATASGGWGHGDDGCRREGVIRRDVKREDGTFRDSVVFSILSEEWAGVKAGLQERLRV